LISYYLNHLFWYFIISFFISNKTQCFSHNMSMKCNTEEVHQMPHMLKKNLTCVKSHHFQVISLYSILYGKNTKNDLFKSSLMRCCFLNIFLCHILLLILYFLQYFQSSPIYKIICHSHTFFAVDKICFYITFYLSSQERKFFKG
jgi:hypothetical protein